MASWPDFSAHQPQLAAAILGLLHQYGPGFGYLAAAPDPGARVHPVSPVITEDGFYCYIVESTRCRALDRYGRYALHSFPPAERDDEAYLAGYAHPVSDPERLSELAGRLPAVPAAQGRLYELTVEVAMVGTHADSPEFWIWRDTVPDEAAYADAVQ